jgi:glycosyltransferase involved in cell wall biosynthesis
VDPDQRLTRRPDLREALLAAALVVPGLLGAMGWPSPLPVLARAAAALIAATGAAVLIARGGPVRTYVEHGALQLRADVPDADAVRHFVERVVDASKEQAAAADAPLPLSVATEIRRLHAHLEQGRLSRDGFARHKQRLLRSLRSHLP